MLGDQAAGGIFDFSAAGDIWMRAEEERRQREEQERQLLAEEGFEVLHLARESSFMPGTQDISVLVCLYCECIVRNKSNHRQRCF